MSSSEPLTPAERSRMRGLAQTMKPHVTLGKAGLTDSVQREIEFNLERHELIKIRLPELDKGPRQELLAEICNLTGAQLCGAVGHTASIYRYSHSATEHVR